MNKHDQCSSFCYSISGGPRCQLPKNHDDEWHIADVPMQFAHSWTEAEIRWRSHRGLRPRP